MYARRAIFHTCEDPIFLRVPPDIAATIRPLTMSTAGDSGGSTSRGNVRSRQRQPIYPPLLYLTPAQMCRCFSQPISAMLDTVVKEGRE